MKQRVRWEMEQHLKGCERVGKQETVMEKVREKGFGVRGVGLELGSMMGEGGEWRWRLLPQHFRGYHQIDSIQESMYSVTSKYEL